MSSASSFHSDFNGSLLNSEAPVDSDFVECTGLELTFPAGQNAYIAYPFGLHSQMQLPWSFYTDNDRFFLRSTSCSRRVLADSPSNMCRKCNNLRSNEVLYGISERIVHGVDESTPLMFFPIGGLVTKLRRRNDQIQVMRLGKHNDIQRIASQSATIDRHKEFVMAVASGKVTRIAPLVAASLNNHESLDAMAYRFYRATEDTVREGPRYNPKGFTPDERMIGLCALRFGGARLADILHRALGLPGLTTLRKHTVIRPLRASPGLPTIAEIVENIDAYTDGEDVPTGPPTIIHQVAMADELHIDKRPRWDDKTNMILGACREHADQTSLEFQQMADAEVFFQDLHDGKVHLASEATVVAIGALSKDPRVYNPRPVCISGTCKAETGPEQADFLRAIHAAINERKNHGNITYRLVSFASDGEATRGAALVLEFMKKTLKDTSPIFPLLEPLEFMNLLVGDDDITLDKDSRHVIKTTRGLLMRKMGINLLGFHITPPIVKQHLLAVGNARTRVDALLNPNDRQDVPLGYQLLKELWSLPDALPIDNPQFSRARRALQIFGRLGYHLVMPYICISLSLRDQLVHLSAAAHLLLILYTTDNAGTDFMANQTFVNIMLMIKNAFFCVAKAKIDIPDSEFFLILRGTDRLEKLFGLIRTAVGTDSNVDVYQLGTRASNLTEIQIILSLRPHWDRGPRRIRLPAIINENGDVSVKADHVSPASCTGDLHVANIVLNACWKEGRKKIEDFIPGGRETLLKGKRDYPDFDMLHPFGKPLFKAPPDPEEAFAPDLNLLRPAPDETNRAEPEPFYDAEGDIEDAIAIHKPRNEKHSPHVLVDGKKVSKASILSQLMQGRSVRISTDRTRRVAGIPAFKSSSTSGLITSDVSLDAACVRIGNPIATLVTCEERIFLAVAHINRIVFGTEDRDSILLDLLYDAGTKISFQIIRLVPATIEDDADKLHDWRWSGAYEDVCHDVPGLLIQPLNPTISNRTAGSPTYLFSTEVLLHVAAGINVRLSGGDFALIHAVKRSEKFPYRHCGKCTSLTLVYTSLICLFRESLFRR
ncbi:hypothetical protein C8R43DRAFT_1082866 [Mycena crocata]|nr:hypothetical protein C8R43DRAFT_1082866 [Mycena crocata]